MNKELSKTLEMLTASVKSIQDELGTLKRRATYGGTDPQQSGFGIGTQQSSTDSADLNPPPNKKVRMEEDEATSIDETASVDEAEDIDMVQGPLVSISKAAATFLEIAFSMKLDNNACKA